MYGKNLSGHTSLVLRPIKALLLLLFPAFEGLHNNIKFVIIACICSVPYVTESVKTGLICTKYTYLFYHIYLFFCVGYTISVSFIKFLRKFCVYDEIFDKVLC